MIDEKDADMIFRMDFRTPPPVTWEWLQDPGQAQPLDRRRAMEHGRQAAGTRREGRKQPLCARQRHVHGSDPRLAAISSIPP
jgi:hypothetical protein